MQPYGRKKIKDGKMKSLKPKLLVAWWENIVAPKKKRARREAKQQIESELGEQNA